MGDGTFSGRNNPKKKESKKMKKGVDKEGEIQYTKQALERADQKLESKPRRERKVAQR